ncbi:uncharacterized protein LOC133822258 [Humulus lupulus]|uniref:uncharacterized protein LOC133822258 n=1 Tax=Humulus lupulus TaxID=3486 RepID=UPI002B40D3CB|nr:uncharacterized protein LOC133822258 [Humulus lupulus]XP_062110516.1 uncharacterized protein LOC133822258 [Humulus lupulus]XP_062110519.1 uncharacterized protein LOC133822258 [Humulus lupulus]XP_062110520.1 uncharacterized protein LOC133822258 [Humulus lupulus]XP_062110521.1 uncharacterized protein LOC133822258 [Humulus lupulus]
MSEEQMDFEDEDYGGPQKLQDQGSSGAISALADEEPMGEDDEYDDLYNDVNIGDGFMQLHRSEAPLPPGGVSNGGLQAQKTNIPVPRDETGVSRELNIPGVSADGKYSSASSQFPGQKEGLAVDNKSKVGFSEKGRIMEMTNDAQVRQMGFQRSLMPHGTGVDSSVIPVKVANEHVLSLNSESIVTRGGPPMLANQTNVDASVNRSVVNENLIRPPIENGSAMLFVGELHWWTTDAELENVLSQYGRVKEIKFFDERASGKSKGYCQVEFYDSSAATACKEGMHGHFFNGRACVVAFATSQTLKQMGAAYASKNQAQNQSQPPQGRRPVNDGVGRGGNQSHQSGDTGGRNFGRGGWGRGGQGINRGGGGSMRGRGGAMSAKNMVGSNAGIGGNAGGAGGYGQGLGGHAFGGPAGGMMNPQGMMGSGFDPSYMGRGGGYGGFPGPAFPGMLSSFPAVNAMGLAAVAPHVNPAFFGRGMANNGMGMMGTHFMDGHHAGMWNDTSMGGWGGDEQGRRTRESSYGGEDGASEYGYGEANNEKGVRSSVASRERERGSDRDRLGNSERRHHEERDQDWNKSEKEQREHGYREEKDGHSRDHRQRERDLDNEDDWDRGQSSSRPRSRSRVMPEDHQRPRSRDVDYGKRRRMPSE